MNAHNYYVYLLTNESKSSFYIGVTNNLLRRTIEHKAKVNEGFTKQYNVNRLVYYEVFTQIKDAIAREKRLKRWNRLWKINLIEKENADWRDLSFDIGVTEQMIQNAKAGVAALRGRY